MAFFDKVGETISSRSRDVIKKAKDLSEVTSLHGQINSQEEIITKAYLEIGQAYFKAHKDISDDIYATQCDTIKVASGKIEQYKVDINNIKGVQVCMNCSAEITVGAAFCPRCGTKVPEHTLEDSIVQQDNVKTCPQCDSPVSNNSEFCTTCGQKLV